MFGEALVYPQRDNSLVTELGGQFQCCIFAVQMKNQWLPVVYYGLALGLLLVAMQFFQYKWILLRHSAEWYIGLIALIFTILGVWAGTRLTRKNPASVAPPNPPPLQSSETVAQELGITPRELDVLRLIALGHSNQEIADTLFVSLNTVKTHISNVLSKLDAERRTQAIQKAKTLGLLA